MKRGVFVTGTDTGAGKTLASGALIHALREAGVQVLPMKPVAAGSIERSGLRLAGWIANAIDPAMAAADENVAALEERLVAPLLGRLPHRLNPDPRSLARHIDARVLLRDRE